ncbi:MAG: TetR/AcrR family transcriptional regulator [Candidatus Bipolaricaulota bacterium]
MIRKSTAQRQQDIVSAVLSLIAESGIQGVTMARIAGRVGLTEAALYRHFKGKLAIVGATIDRAFDELLEALEPAGRGGDVLGKLKAALTAHVSFVEGRPWMARILFSDEVHFNSKELKQKLIARGDEVAQRIGGMLALGKATGELDRELDVQSAVVMYRGIVQAQVMLWTQGKLERLMERQEGLWTLYRRAIGG